MRLLFHLLIALALLGMCLAASVLQTRSVSEADKTTILNLHNVVRAGVSNPTASNMRKMYWSDALANAAQIWVDQCVFGHDTNAERNQAANMGVAVGQNMGKGRSWSYPIMQQWYGEAKLFNYSIKSDYAITDPFLHFTQVIWSDSSLVGCAMKNCGGIWNTYVCNYAIGGNKDGQKVYKSGLPCADCKDKCVDGALCDCPNGRICKHGGTLDLNTCTCSCKAIWTGDECETLNCPSADPEECGKEQPYGYPESYCISHASVVPDKCPYMCGLCTAAA